MNRLTGANEHSANTTTQVMESDRSGAGLSPEDGRWLTQGEYQAVMGSNPSFFTGDTKRPVEQVSWFDATNYCATLTQRERLAGRIATNRGHRLPTAAEWEYACRTWTSTRFSPARRWTG